MPYCIMRKNHRVKLADWPEAEREAFREADRAGHLEGYSTERAAEQAIPAILRPLVIVAEYTTL